MSLIRFDKYLTLLEQLIPDAAGFVICDVTGQVVAGHGAGVDDRAASCPQPRRPSGEGTVPGAGPDIVPGPDGNELIRQAVSGETGELYYTLLVSAGPCMPGKPAGDREALFASLESIAACIAREYELNRELDAMAIELGSRYEELNLVYGVKDDIVGYEFEAEMINQLLESCIEHLGVSMVSLILSDQDSVHYAVSGTNPVSDPYLVLQYFGREVYAGILYEGDCLIINNSADSRRRQLSLDIPYKVLACPVYNSQGSPVAMLVCLNDLSRQDFYNSDKRLLEVIARKVSRIIQSNHDSMTGLLNPHAFGFVVRDAIRTAYRRGISHVYMNIDIDQLSVINDSMGRTAGDDAILAIAALLREKLRTTDEIGYLGEGRFGVLLEKCVLDEGLFIAHNLCNAVATTDFAPDGQEMELSISIGVVLIGPDARSADEVLEAAEMARDTAKQGGKSQVRVYRDDSLEFAERKGQMQWIGRIQKWMRSGQLRLYSQEIRPSRATSEKYHFEILLRAVDDEGDVILPSEFIPAAERYNLMPSLDRWVIDSTFAALRSNGLAQHSHEGVVAVNLSAQSLADNGLVEYIGEKFMEYGLSPDCICFEITETTAFRNLQVAREVIEGVKAMGCHFALDDFGTGLSSFSYLRELPVDYLKIDGSFVRAMLGDKIAYAMTSSINQIGHVMGIKTVAEYVESAAIADQLELIGVDYLQGNSIREAIPLDGYLAEKGLRPLKGIG